MQLAKQYGCKTVAFPLISSGVYGYPKAEALRIAVNTITAFLFENDMTVYIVIFDHATYQISEKLFTDIQQYIDDHYVAVHEDPVSQMMQRKRIAENMITGYADSYEQSSMAFPSSLQDALDEIDESFSEMLLRKIDEAGIKDSECYKRANIDRKLFSKIRSDVHYKPSKQTVLAFAIALKLSLDETNEMLMKAGYALSHSNQFDIIIEYFIRQGNYNIFEINEALFAFDQQLLGSK